MDMQRHIRQEIVRGLVQQRITCRFTGQVLDMDTCAVLIDRDGDPADVLDPRAADLLTDSDRDRLAAQGYTVQVAPFAG